MESNICIGCRFGSVKIEIFVPENCDVQEFVQKTRLFASEMKLVTGEKRIHYTLKFDSETDSLGLGFDLNCSCILNVKQRDCSNFLAENKTCRVKHLQQSKKQREMQLEAI
jgi:hypothetical protein